MRGLCLVGSGLVGSGRVCEVEFSYNTARRAVRRVVNRPTTMINDVLLSDILQQFLLFNFYFSPVINDNPALMSVLNVHDRGGRSSATTADVVFD